MKRYSWIVLSLFLAAASYGQSVISRSPGIDGHFVDLAQQVPGFGGYFFDEQGDLNVYVTDMSRAEAARALVADVARNRPQRVRNPYTRPAAVIVRHADYDFVQLDGWRRRVSMALTFPGVTMIDADEGANRVFVGIAQESNRAAVLSVVDSVGVPREAVTIGIVPAGKPITNLYNYVRPVIGGLGIGWGYYQYPCTLGVNVWYGNSVAGIPTGTPGFFTASHCSDHTGLNDHDTYYQGGYPIGTEAYDPPWFQGGVCPLNYFCRHSDVLFATYNNPNDRLQGYVATTTIRGFGDTQGSTVLAGQLNYNAIVPYPTQGQYLDKVGQTTGWGEGAVRHTCVDTRNDDIFVDVLCQDYVAAIVAPGDSGAPVFQTGFYGTAFAGIVWELIPAHDSEPNCFVFAAVNRIQQDMGTNVTYTP